MPVLPRDFYARPTLVVARALIGKTNGDSVEVPTPRGNKSYEIVTVAFG